jgi:aminotransferase
MLTEQEQVDAVVAEYQRRRDALVAGLNAIPGWHCRTPQGAFYAFPNVEISGMDEDTFAWTLLEEEKVAVVPGTAFGAAGKGHVRACYATAYEQIEQALERMQRFVRRHG